MNRLIVATRNPGKVKEFRDILKGFKGLDIIVETLCDFPGVELPPERGLTFAENARLKAGFLTAMTDFPALGDDSGLEVDYLNGAPGIYSARFAGEPADDERNNAKLLELLKDVPWEQRTARFRCVVALVTSDGETYYGEGTLEGKISFEPRGKGGFGYDPLLFLPEYGQTVAELSSELK
ncbi:MAG: RdgB/HAM1 family non-canonical purine NTP pyrophosphatase, partial [Clostridia bacterium]|nr:RdgB/HAM1 family non-canonical purine NTP pyrophosphatase [Clostridia bacterium]